MVLPTLRRNYVPRTDMTVDEQLAPFRGRCPFRQYVPSEPAKYGIKIWWKCYAVTLYPLRGEVYLGRQPGENQQGGLRIAVVRNTTGSWFQIGEKHSL